MSIFMLKKGKARFLILVFCTCWLEVLNSSNELNIIFDGWYKMAYAPPPNSHQVQPAGAS